MQPQVVLASRSPRRIELLKNIVEDFIVAPADVDEAELEGESPWHTAERLAAFKTRALRDQYPEALIIGGDTVVALPEEAAGAYDPKNLVEIRYRQLSKPADKSEAKRMLRSLSGRWHLVVTGLSLLAPWHERTTSETTMVLFKNLTDQEIETYVATSEPLDKAGSYAIQGMAGGFVQQIEGSRSNVVGLPLELLERELEVARSNFAQ